jgi:hypothetical protein
MPTRRLVWIFAGIALAILAYGLWWRHAAGLLQETLNAFRSASVEQGVKANWDGMTVSGFPFRLRAKLENPSYENKLGRMSWQAKGLTVETLPWSLSQISFMAHGPQTIDLGPQLAVAGEAKESGVSLLFDGNGLPKQLDVAAKYADAELRGQDGQPIRIKGDVLAAHWRIDPEDANAGDGRDYDAAVNGTAIVLSGVELPFGPNVQDFRLQVSLRGVPALQGVDGAMDLASWRALGAPLTIRNLTFVSGGVDVRGVGDLALDRDGTLQGQLNLTLGGFDKIVAALSAAGAIPAEAKSNLFVTSTMLAATGAKVPMPLTFKDGKTYLGPAQIGPAPRFVR